MLFEITVIVDDKVENAASLHHTMTTSASYASYASKVGEESEICCKKT
jgi:hypothetical protein